MAATSGLEVVTVAAALAGTVVASCCAGGFGGINVEVAGMEKPTDTNRNSLTAQ